MRNGERVRSGQMGRWEPSRGELPPGPGASPGRAAYSRAAAAHFSMAFLGYEVLLQLFYLKVFCCAVNLAKFCARNSAEIGFEGRSG